MLESYLSVQGDRVERLVDLIDLPVLSGKQHFSFTREMVQQEDKMCCKTHLEYLHVVLKTP